MTFSCLQKLLEKYILLFYQKRLKFWFSRRYTIIHSMSTLPKIWGLGGEWGGGR